MNNKRPYNHILKNLFHEPAEEIIPLLWPGYLVEEVLYLEMPDVESIPGERPASELEQGIVDSITPGAKVTKVFKNKWIEHSGHFERAYRFQNPESEKLSFLAIEFQMERDAKMLPYDLLSIVLRVTRYITEEEKTEDEGHGNVKQKKKRETIGKKTYQKGTLMNPNWYVYPMILCPFPQNVPALIREEFFGHPTLTFNFKTLNLWEKDAREFLNSQVSAVFFLLPAMKNADEALLGLAIEQLARKFKDDEQELGRHLTGMNMMLQMSDTMSAEEKLAAQEHLKPFAHLIKDDSHDE